MAWVAKGKQASNHKYYAREQVGVRNGQNQYRYFYSKGEYDAFKNKPGKANTDVLEVGSTYEDTLNNKGPGVYVTKKRDGSNRYGSLKTTNFTKNYNNPFWDPEDALREMNRNRERANLYNNLVHPKTYDAVRISQTNNLTTKRHRDDSAALDGVHIERGLDYKLEQGLNAAKNFLNKLGSTISTKVSSTAETGKNWFTDLFKKKEEKSEDSSKSKPKKSILDFVLKDVFEAARPGLKNYTLKNLADESKAIFEDSKIIKERGREFVPWGGKTYTNAVAKLGTSNDKRNGTNWNAYRENPKSLYNSSMYRYATKEERIKMLKKLNPNMSDEAYEELEYNTRMNRW